MFPYSHAVGGTFWRRFTIKLSYFKQKYGHKKQLALFTVSPPRNPGTFLFTTYPFSKNAYINHGSRQVGNQDKNCVVGQAHATRNSSP